jgi:hypothetical protein
MYAAPVSRSAVDTPDEAKNAISDAREAVKWFQESTVEQQETFLTLLLFKSRN